MEQKVVLKAMCIFEKDGRVLVSCGTDEVKGESFYRFLGGHIEFGEKAEDGIRREIREELGSEIENLEFLGAEENIFTYKGNPCHEVIFLFRGDLARKELYEKESVRVAEPGHEFDAHWVLKEELLKGETPLLPPQALRALQA